MRHLLSLRGMFAKGANAAAADPTDFVSLSSYQAASVNFMSAPYVDAYIKTTTGYAKFEWWDGTSAVYGTGVSGSAIYPNKTIAAAYDRKAKTIRAYATTSAGSPTGSVSELALDTNTSVYNIGLTASPNLTLLNVFGDGSLTGCLTGAIPDFGSFTKLQTLKLGNQVNVTSVGLTNSSQLATLWLQYAKMNRVDLTPIQGTAQYLDFSGINAYGGGVPGGTCDFYGLTSCTVCTTLTLMQDGLTSYNFGGMTGLQYLNVEFNTTMKSLIISNCTSIKQVRARSMFSLNTVRAVNVGKNMTSTYYSSYSAFGDGISLAYGTSMTAGGLNQLYTDLTAGGVGTIIVTFQPGAATDNPAIATAKGYTVVG